MSLPASMRSDDQYVDPAACGEFQAHPSHEKAMSAFLHHVQLCMKQEGLLRCEHCWLLKKAHKQHVDEHTKGWLHKDWHPENQAIDVSHFTLDIFNKLNRFQIPTYNQSDVFEIGSILYNKFSKQDIPVPSHRLAHPGDRDTFINCFEAFYKRLFSDVQMKVMFAAGEDGYGMDLGYKEHGRRLGLFCLWRICGDKEYMKSRSSATAKCPYQMNLYHKLAPGHGNAKRNGGIKVGDRFAFTVTQSRRWLGHQWCAWRENASEDLCKAVVSWLASIIDLYGPFADDSMMAEEEALKRALELSLAVEAEEAAKPRNDRWNKRTCPFSGAMAANSAACPFSDAAEGSARQVQLPEVHQEELQEALRASTTDAAPAGAGSEDQPPESELQEALRESERTARLAVHAQAAIQRQEDQELQRALRESALT
mmetsp:Transcript_8595/g.15236  ORF Transcript_8595/g.15236 Transcript_8595/m.15236 type:complete len:424 (-) Transcript_8595:499-1770(-)